MGYPYEPSDKEHDVLMETIERGQEAADRYAEVSIFRAIPGYPWLPCPICKAEGFPRAIESCDHTVLERARVAHPGLIIPTTEKPNN
jgi:hypothetical protein